MTGSSTFLVMNAGSSSIKYALYKADDLSLVARKNIEVAKAGGYASAIQEVLDLISIHNVAAVGHRIVHGGKDYAAPVRIDAKVLADLDALTPLAPLHQPHNLSPVKAIQTQYPALPQVAAFDTAFHRTMPRLSQLYAIPRKLTDEGVIRYGFHGLSYEYISSVLPQYADEATAKGRVIVAHLGNGASMAALKNGKSVATTMGFTPLDGLMMGTRAGATDPGILLHLLEKGETAQSLSEIFLKQSGLKGVSGLTGDVRALLASSAPEAGEALDLFALYAARQAASLAVDLGGMDAIVFTGGIGENSDVMREKICARLAHMGVRMEGAANHVNGPDITAPGGAVKILVIPTNEELMLARHVQFILRQPAVPLPIPSP